jgi:hypothetical protein
MRTIIKIKKIFLFSLLLLIAVPFGCSTAKDAQERRGLMMPRKDELPRNKKYTATEKKKTHKHKPKKVNKGKRMF